MSVPTVLENRLSSLRDSVVQKAKGGEKEMESEWERLEKLSKDELIIELVRMRNLYGLIREDQSSDCVYPMIEPLHTGEGDSYVEGQLAPEVWAERIALYTMKHPKDGMFYSCDLMDYGLTSDQSYDVCKKLSDEGRMKLPSGIECGDDFLCRSAVAILILKQRRLNFLPIASRSRNIIRVQKPTAETALLLKVMFGSAFVSSILIPRIRFVVRIVDPF